MATAVQNYAGSDTEEKPRYGLGVLAGVEYSKTPDAQLSDQEINALRELCVKAAKRDHPARLVEVIQAWEAALFLRGFQFLIPLRGGGWKIPGESTGFGPSMQMDLALLPTNIYSTYGQIIQSSLTRSVPNVRFQAQDPTKDAQLTAAESAEKFVKVFARNNDLIVIQLDAARYLWTDGRFCYYTRFEKDGQRFGWEEDDEPDNLVPENEPNEAEASIGPVSAEASSEPAGSENPNEETGEGELEDALANRTPRGQELRTAHGKLEVKLVPMMANSLDECDVLQYETEVSVSRAKGMFPQVADKIKAGGSGVAEGEIAKLARQNVKLGMQSTYVTSDSIAEDVTIQRTWLRPSELMGIGNEAVRDGLIKKFPDGARAVYAGETFCGARNESIDDCWALGQAYSGDGQNRNALGTSLLPIQKRLNNWLDLMNDYFVRGIPKKWMDSKTFNVDAIRNQTNIPGDIGSFKRQPNIPMAELVWVEPQITQPANLAQFVEQYSGPLAELLSGGYPALSGGQPDTDTFRGLALQRDQALGRLGPTWHSIQCAEATSVRQAVRWASKCRDKSINEKIPGSEAIRLEINDLKANILCYPEADENFPETYPQRQQRLMSIFDSSAKNPQLQEVLYNPANLEFMQRMMALPELYIKEVASYKKQLGELEILLTSNATVNPAFEQATQTIANMKAQGVDPMLLQQAEQELASVPPELSSVPIDPEVDDSDTEGTTVWIYLNSAEGRKAKRNNPEGFKNARLHFLEHLKVLQDKVAGAAAGAQKPVSESINFKDLPADGKAQLAAKGGIKLDQNILAASEAAKQPPPSGAIQ